MIAMVLVGLAVSIIWYWLMTGGHFVSDPAKAGPIGDSFGPLSSLFSSLALGAAIIATYYQIREFRSQLTEMRQSSEEMKKQTETYEQQLIEAKLQTHILREQNIAESIRHSSELLPTFMVGRYSSHANEDGYRLKMSGSHPIFNVFCVFEENGTPIQMKNGFRKERAIFSSEHEETGSTTGAPTCATITYTLVSGIVLKEVLSLRGYNGASNREQQVSDLAKIVMKNSRLVS